VRTVREDAVAEGGERGPALVVVAHPDDEALGFAGVILRHRDEGDRVAVAVVTNGDAQARGRLPLRFCGAPRGWPARVARLGLCRARETVEAMALLGLRWSLDPRESDILFLGYPNNGLETIARCEAPWTGDAAGLHHTYALGRSWRRCDGDLRYLLEGRHSRLCAADLAQDLDSLFDLVRPAHVYTHVEFDGHPDHAETYRQVLAAVERLGRPITLHCTLIHPEGSGKCMYASALEWPNPSDAEVASPFDRFTPHLDFEPPPVADAKEGSLRSWGPWGEPDELVELPLPMRHPHPAQNLKWQIISRYRSQLLCQRDRFGSYHASCGYMRAFVKRHEFFWTRRVG
jgi:LmbE family N-acetylglucosaminyl deacetylase